MQQCARFLGWCVLGVAVSCLSLCPQSASPGNAAPPKSTNKHLIDYLRYAEGFTPSVNMTLDNPEPTVFTGFYKVLVHLKAGKNEAVRTYYSHRMASGLSPRPFSISRSRHSSPISTV